MGGARDTSGGGGGMSEVMTKTVFLGGTCNESAWRDCVIENLKIDYFNPVVDDWTEDCMAEEVRQREMCDFVLYVITPLMTGTYAIAEAVDDSNKRPGKTVFCFLESDRDESGEIQTFTAGQLRSLQQVRNLISGNGAAVCWTLQEVCDYFNGKDNG